MTYQFIKDLIFILNHKEEISEIITNEDSRLPNGMNPELTEVKFKDPISNEKIHGFLLIPKYKDDVLIDVTMNIQATNSFERKNK